MVKSALKSQINLFISNWQYEYEIANCLLPIAYFKGFVLFLILCFESPDAKCQSITLEKAIEIANENSLILKNEKLKIDYLKTISKAAFDLPNTGISSEFGQFNSNLFDVKMGFVQNAKLPTVYRNQKKLLDAEAVSGKLEEDLLRKNMNKQVSQVFYFLLFLDEKNKLLLEADSLLSKYLEITNVQVMKGDKNITEKLTVENQLNQIKLLQLEWQNEFHLAHLQFKYLLNSELDFKPQADKFQLEFIPNENFQNIDNQYIIKYLNHEKLINNAKIELENSKKLPEISAGIYVQSFKFNDSDQNNFLGTVGQIGLSFPFFNKAPNHKKTALNIANQVTENKLSIEQAKLKNKYNESIQIYNKNLKTVNYFETTLLKNLHLLHSLTTKQYQAGEISVGEWIRILNQNNEIKNKYIDSVNNLNQSIIDLKYLNNE